MITPLFDISLWHDFFEHRIFQGAVITPDDKTAEIIEHYQLIMRPQMGCFALYNGSQQKPESLLHYLDCQLDGEPLRFCLSYQEDNFNIITDLPIDWGGQIDFSSREYSLEDSNKKRLMPQLAERTRLGAGLIGTIDIYPLDLLEGLQQYSVQFPVRHTHWEYYVVNRSNAKLDQPLITDNRGCSFEAPEKVALVNGEQALRFSSGEHTFALQEMPTQTFKLINRVANMSQQNHVFERSVINVLPTPRADQINLRHENGTTYVYSQMYVYL